MLLAVIIILILGLILIKIVLDFLKEKELIKSDKFEEYLRYKKESEEKERKFIINVLRFLVLIFGIVILGGSLSARTFSISGILIGAGLIIAAIFTNKILNLD